MDDLCSILGVLLIVLLVVTLVGHGIWVLAAKAIRALVGHAPEKDLDPTSITARQLERLHSSGRLDLDTYDRAINALFGGDSRRTPILRPPTEVQPWHQPPPVPSPPPEQPAPAPQPQPIPAAPFAPHFTPAPPPPLPVLPIQEQPAVAHAAPQPTPPRRSLGEMLARFMEESNIRWGELIGGLLFLGCAIALGVTFRQEIARYPPLKYSLLTGVLASLFAVGLYTEHRWKLPNTSRGVLLIAMLLVPLYFLALTAMTTGRSGWLAFTGDIFALGIFGYLTFAAGRVLAHPWAAALSAGVMGPSAVLVIIGRWTAGGVGATPLLILSAVAVAVYAAANAWAMSIAARQVAASGDDGAGLARLANKLLMTLGVCSAAAMAPVALLVHRSGDPAATLRLLAPVLSMAGLPALAAGLLLRRWLDRADAAGPERSSELTSTRMLGTAAGVLGAIAMLAGIALAWPSPAGVLATALLDSAALTAVAFWFGIPAAHFLALPCAAVAYLMGVHLVGGELTPQAAPDAMRRALASARTGLALIPFFAALTGAAEGFIRRDARKHAEAYGIVAAALAAISLLLVSLHGLGRAADHGATWAYAAYAIGALALAWRWRREAAAWAAGALAGLSIVQGLVFAHPISVGGLSAWTTALLVHATVMTALALAARFTAAARRNLFEWPLTSCGLISSALASMLILVGLVAGDAPRNLTHLSIHAAWLAALWLVGSVFHRLPALFTAFQAALTAAVCFATASVLQVQPYFAAARHPWIDPRTLSALGTAVALLSGLFVALRLTARRLGWHDRAAELLEPAWPAWDRAMTLAALALAAVLSISAAAPAVGRELAAAGSALATTQPTPVSNSLFVLIAAVSAVLLAGLWRRFERSTIHALIIAGACAATALAAALYTGAAGASSLRHLSAAFLLAGSAFLWWRQALAPAAARLGLDHADTRGLPRESGSLLFLLTLPVILCTTLFVAAKTLAGARIAGPAPGTVFHAMGASLNYLLPLAGLFIALVGHALRERSGALAIAAGLVLNLTVTLAYALHLATSQLPFDGHALVRLAQFNAIASAAFALAWLGVLRFSSREHLRIPELLNIQAALPLIPLLLLFLPAEFHLAFRPGQPIPHHHAVGGPWSWLAWALAGAAALSVHLAQHGRLGAGAGAACAALLVLGSLAALTAPGSGWFNFHVLLVARALSAYIMLSLSIFTSTRTRLEHADEPTNSPPPWPPALTWAVLLGGLTLLLSLLAYADPAGPAWSLGGTAAVALLCVGIAFASLNSAWLYGAGLLLSVAVNVWWLRQPPAMRPRPQLLGFLQVNTLAAAASGLGLLLLELFILRPTRSQVVHRGPLAYHRLAAGLSVLGVTVITTLLLLGTLIGFTPIAIQPWLLWLPPLLTLALVFATLYDPDARLSLAGLYITGLLLTATVMHALGWQSADLAWRGVVALGVYSVLTAFLFTQRTQLLQLADSLAIPRRDHWPAAGPAWLSPAIAINAALITLAAGVITFTSGARIERLASATSVIAAAVALSLLTHGGPAPSRLHRAVLALAAIGVVLWGCAWPTPGGTGVVLDYQVIIMTALGALTALYAVGLVKLLRRQNPWTDSARSLVPHLAAGAALALVAVLATEIATYTPAGTPMSLPAFSAVALTILSLAVVAVICAAIPGRDPLDLPDRTRTAYVYAAELLLLLLFVHVKLVHPDLLRLGIWTRFWPLIILLLAFLGAGLSELFRRQNRSVLAEPLENSAAFLPVFPIAAWWALSDTWRHTEVLNYGGVLLLAAALYAALAFLRRSFLFGILAALAANGALWHFLHHTPHLGFAKHPQLWLVPAALSVLAAAWLNRQRLSEEQMRNVRYLCLITIYLSSTADIFINGVAQAPYLPLALALLSVAGVLAGILLRVQSFLYMGTVFLLVSLTAMIRYATIRVDHYWPWLVAGLFVGASLIVIFALFEKKRTQMLALVDGLKEWRQ